jgi:hypothetical protein
VTAPVQSSFEIRLYGRQDRDPAFKFWDEYGATYAKYDAFSLVPDRVAEYTERVELRAATPPNSYSLGSVIRAIQGDPDADVEIISTGLYVVIVGPSLGFVKNAWDSWMRHVSTNMEQPRDIRATVSNY